MSRGKKWWSQNLVVALNALRFPFHKHNCSKGMFLNGFAWVCEPVSSALHSLTHSCGFLSWDGAMLAILYCTRVWKTAMQGLSAHNQYNIKPSENQKSKNSHHCICVNHASVYIQKENKHEISPRSGTEWKALVSNQVDVFSHYRSDYGDVWAVCSHMIRLQHRCIVFRTVLMSVMGFCFHIKTLEAPQRLFLGWKAYSNYLPMIKSTEEIKKECFAIIGVSCKCLLIANEFSIQAEC